MKVDLTKYPFNGKVHRKCIACGVTIERYRNDIRDCYCCDETDCKKALHKVNKLFADAIYLKEKGTKRPIPKRVLSVAQRDRHRDCNRTWRAKAKLAA